MTTVDLDTPIGLLIGTDRLTVTSQDPHAHIYPGNGTPNATVALAGPAEVDLAVTAATDAQRQWMALGVDRRRDSMIDLADVVHESLGELAGYFNMLPASTVTGSPVT
ncbi:aldehyde dehydrogenase family protein [Mycobacterium sp. C31M]